ncbi:WhiB family transcriptional regulator [Streptacidiphilus fuscans]|uniref:Transcriptional regulator WhiB n=1 Tax=Streptacidiphilus fuscans TaxID=2789292 RepID=A0A931B515_9ACTN|nr:WhiB family transcriptional regulator [Streptacidiphilus fuscans]MBF9069121.1 WhiB family transcriptional regulator [Streptacidiphilus fuscans]
MGRKPDLPGPMEQAWVWQEEAACASYDTQLFFHPAGERGRDFEDRERAAKGVCATCPVLVNCRAYALAAREPYGVWGGLSEDERATVLRRRRRSPARIAA